MLKRALSLCVVLSVFAGMAVGQSGPSLSFIDRWGGDAPQFVEYDLARVRLTDPSLDSSGLRDTLTVTVSSVLGTDAEIVTLIETGKRTGVFEGGIDLRINGGSPAFPGILETMGPSGAFDSIQVDGPDGLLDTAQVVPSILHLVDDQGDEAAAFAAGGRVYVRLVDRLSDTPNPENTTVTVTTTSGDSEVLTLTESAVSGGEFTGSIPGRLAAGATPGDGVLDTLSGDTLTASHEDVNHVTSSSDTAPVAGATLRFVDSHGLPTSTAFEGTRITLQAISASANVFPAFADEIYATLTSELGGDQETLTLIETGASTGVFEGRIRMGISQYGGPGNGQIQISLSNPGEDVIEANVSGASPATLHPSGSSTSLLDVWGRAAETFPQGGTLTVRVEDPSNDSPYGGLQTSGVQIRSLTTGDVEYPALDETGVGSNVYEGTIPLEIGPAVPEDGKLQAQVEGEVLEARHNDWNGVTVSTDTGRLSLSEMWFLDEDSRQPTGTVLENTRVTLRLFDALRSTPGAADIASENAGDGENLFFAPYLGKPGFFEGSIPTETQSYSTPSGDDILGTRANVNSLDGLETITAWAGSDSATARAAYSEIAFVDAYGNEVGSYALGEAVRVRLRSGSPGTPATDQVQITLLSLSTGDQETMTLGETGPETNVYLGSFPTTNGTASPGNGWLETRAGEALVAEDSRADYPISFTLDRAIITASRVTFVDRQNAPTDLVFRGGQAYLEAFDRAANTNAGAVETLDVTVRVYADSDGQLGDTETVTLTETGADTALFRGSIPVSMNTFGINGVLDTRFNLPYQGPDRLRAELGGSSDTAAVTDSVVRFLDVQGGDASIYGTGDTIRVRLHREASNESPSSAETAAVSLTSWTGRAASSPGLDSESLVLTETGPDTGVFEGEIQTVGGAAVLGDGTFQVQPGSEIQAEYNSSWTEDADRAFMAGSLNQPPVAVDDTVTTPEDTPITINLLANDGDPEGQTLTIVQVIPYGSGGLQVNPDGTRTYIPSPNFNGGPEIYLYEVSDGSLSDFGTLQVFVTPVNDPPVAIGNSATVNEDSSILINVLANDSDVDGDTLSILSFTQGTKGSVSASGGGLLYTPNPNANGADSFTYTIQDPSGATATATVSVTITAINDPPIAVANSATTNEDTAVTISVLANDSDPDGDSLTVSAVTQGSHGSVTRLTTSVIYTPAANYFGTDSFTYTASDGKGGTATATVSVTINSVNDLPVAGNNSATTNEDTPVTINVLANDSDVDGDPLTITSATNGLKGTVTVNAGATVTYTPNLNANGSDSFTYTISDGKGGTRTATVTVTIVAVNDAPNAVSDARTTPEDTAINIAILANDSDPESQTLTVTAITQATNGSVVLNADKTVTYTPNWNFVGSDSFTYTISDGTLTATATVTLSVTNANDPPYAVDDEITLAEDETVAFYVLSNDSDPEGDTIYVASVLPATHGVVSGPGLNYVLTYTPKPNFHGEDFFVYTVSDTNFGTNSATVMITVTPVDDPPVAVNDAATVAEDSPATAVNVLANDTDVDGGPKSIDSVTQPANGTVVITGGGTGLTYQPNANYCNNPPGTALDTFTYTLTPGGSTATVTMTVTCTDDAPTAVGDAATVNEDSGANTIDVQANDADADGGPKSISSVTQPANGTVVITGGGTGLTYQPNANFCSATPDAFTYTLSPGGSSATASVTVTCVDDPPVAVADAATVNEDSGANAINVLTNDTDADGGPISVQSVTQPTNGTVVITGGGTSLTYQPNANFCTAGTPDTFTYTLSPGGSSTIVSVMVTCVDDPPAAVADAATVNEDSGANAINVLANDTDVDGGASTIASVTQPANGTVAITNGGADLAYTPNANFCGTPDTFTYALSPGGSTATVTTTVTCVDDSPVAVTDAATVTEDSGANPVNVLANDTDIDVGPISIAAVTQPANGTVVITNGGADLTYTPNANFCGTPDTFTYALSPGGSTAVVSVSVTCLNDAPVVDLDANDDQGTAGNNFAVTFTEGEAARLIEDPFDTAVTDVDSTTLESITITITNLLDVGSETLSADVTGTSITANYVSATGVLTLTGPDTLANFQTVLRKVRYLNTDESSDATPRVIQFVANDGSTDGNTAVSTVTVVPVDTPPTAVNDAATVNEDSGATAIDVLANDTDPDGGPISISSVTQPTNGTVIITGGGTGLTYQPNTNFCGTPGTFTYTLTPGGSTTTVTVTVTCINDAPDAVNDAAATPEDTGVTIPVLANDTDVDGNPLQVTAVTQGTKGAVTINANGTVTYTPALNTNGADAFTYTVSDGNGGSDTATVTVSVAAVNDAPVAGADTATTREGAAVTVSVLANDSDVEGNTLTVTSVTTPAGGTAAVNANNTVTYTPGANFNGTGSFTYTVSDGQGGTATATVTVTVKDALERVAVLATHGVWIQTGADVLSGDVIVNQTGAAPFLTGSIELTVAGTVTTPAGYDVQANRISVASGATVASDVFYNQLTGTVTGPQTSPLTLPVFATLPTFLTATPGATDVNVGTNGTRTLAAGSYRDLIVGRKGTVTFTGGTYHFRTVQIDREAKLLFTAAATVRVQQKLSTLQTTQIQPAPGATIDGSDIVIHVGGGNGTGGGLTETPKAVEIAVDNVIWANIYAPNGTIWMKDRTQVRGVLLGKDVQLGPDVQVTLDSSFTGQ